MKIGYIDAGCGASGDMIVASLLDAGLPIARLKKELTKVPLAGYRVSEKLEERNDPRIGHPRPARRFLVELSQKEHGRSLREIVSLIKKSGLDALDKEKILAIFQRLAAAETKVHGTLPDHFHQVGEIDSIIDIVAAVVGFRILGVKKLYCSTPNLGSPAPATSLILKNLNVRIDADQPECTTPTAAAILAELTSFQAAPPFNLLSVGYGTGSRNEPAPNILSFFLGETVPAAKQDRVLVIETNLDDMPPFAYEKIFQDLQKAGILDFILTPGLMKKNRLGQKLEIMTKKEDLDKVLKIIFRETSTFGVRVRETDRIILEREFKEVNARNHRVAVKVGRYQGKVVKVNPEYEDIKRIAETEDLPLLQVMDEAKVACLSFKRTRHSRG
ncbi:MAG: nickel pincer cofactor biosynthesis protein LarC [Candidatus Omnitrophica bacterium]|nr:nickel pincer cofactor biosynthesis protein LarC [Candidatus Omnitrophota bacterium]